MGLWGAGVLEGYHQWDFVAGVCEALLKRIVSVLNRPDTLGRRTPKAIDLLLCRMDLLAAVVTHVSTHDRGIFGGRLFPCTLPDPDAWARWRRPFFKFWDARAGKWDAPPAFKQARRARYEVSFDRLAELAAAQQRQPESAARRKQRAGGRGRRARPRGGSGNGGAAG